MEIKIGKIEYGDRILCREVEFSTLPGDCILLCGANGSGKSTMLRMIASVYPQATLIPTGIPKVKGFTLEEFILTSCYSESNWRSRISPAQQKRIDNAVSLLGLDGKGGEDLRGRDISTLSDGEFQKACIAVALVRNASVIFLDEPTAFLDAENRISVLQVLRKLCTGEPDYGRDSLPAIVFSTHDLYDGMAAATKVFALGADGIFRCSETEVAETVKSIFSNPESFK